jgi:mutual gliding-motility protein MglA
MVSINYAFREIISKIVYYGPGLSGKTTNLQYVFKKVPSETRGELISLATDADRTLYFDFLPVNVGTIQGFATKFQLYTVPGQVYYNATRKLVLRGVDGLVFVADSQLAKMDENIESLQNLKDNLEEYGYDMSQLPLVIQYNKRDLPGIASIEELEKILNPGGLPYFEAVACTGDGVFKTLKAISKIVLDQVKAKRMEPANKVLKTPTIAPKVPVGVVSGGGGGGAIARPKIIEAPQVIKPEIMARGVELGETGIKSGDKIGTRSIESSVISDIPGRVVVSDSPDDKNHHHDEPEAPDHLEETTERAVIQGEPLESTPKNINVGQDFGLTHDYSDVEPKPDVAQTNAWPNYGGGFSEDEDDELADINLKSSLPLRKPQMAESRKVKNKTGKFNIFGWFKKSKK